MHREIGQYQGESETASRHRFHVGLAQGEAEVREAQRLRYKVFVEEFGARLHTRVPDHDIDFYDAHCEHLIVRDLAIGRVVGTYRILSPEAALRVGGYYAENEFCLTRLQHLRGRMVEI
ncbi:MAG: GNAT family N-acetyltransferase, partial [Nevskiales bacterium]